jgi:hypothetical protein
VDSCGGKVGVTSTTKDTQMIIHGRGAKQGVMWRMGAHILVDRMLRRVAVLCALT